MRRSFIALLRLHRIEFQSKYADHNQRHEEKLGDGNSLFKEYHFGNLNKHKGNSGPNRIRGGGRKLFNGQREKVDITDPKYDVTNKRDQNG